ncbi:hypothetical protein [Cochlodiniinecator piscidefendens]|uniref:hypothetical protein n=1 Tax=Cochlodiniinecator piscidefendens TaxID=2715756 RepID=UPI00140CFA4E|nr:hypothetical protein [Cochlodiniinecator piscidefendens]
MEQTISRADILLQKPSSLTVPRIGKLIKASVGKTTDPLKVKSNDDLIELSNDAVYIRVSKQPIPLTAEHFGGVLRNSPGRSPQQVVSFLMGHQAHFHISVRVTGKDPRALSDKICAVATLALTKSDTPHAIHWEQSEQLLELDAFHAFCQEREFAAPAPSYVSNALAYLGKLKPQAKPAVAKSEIAAPVVHQAASEPQPKGHSRFEQEKALRDIFSSASQKATGGLFQRLMPT